MPVHLEFTVEGPPVSHQSNDKLSLRRWKHKVRGEAGKIWSPPPLTELLKFTLINFHEGVTAPMDDDNMVKPIRDALNNFVYVDDKQITHSELIQVPIGAPMVIRGAPAVILDAFKNDVEFLYVRIETAPQFLQFSK
jgi:crossover junction endodeoxyribonuclease RusA